MTSLGGHIEQLAEHMTKLTDFAGDLTSAVRRHQECLQILERGGR